MSVVVLVVPVVVLQTSQSVVVLVVPVSQLIIVLASVCGCAGSASVTMCQYYCVASQNDASKSK